MNSPVLTIISFLIIFTVVVVSHEFGHFLIARINGIRVLEFSIGMGPVLFRKKGKNACIPRMDLCLRYLRERGIRGEDIDIVFIQIPSLLVGTGKRLLVSIKMEPFPGLHLKSSCAMYKN